MRAGALRHRIVLQEMVVTQDDAGGIVKGWQDVATVWAAIEPLQGREFWEAQKANSQVQGKIIIRHREVDPTMRVLFKGRTLEIDSVIHPLEKREETHLLYREALA